MRRQLIALTILAIGTISCSNIQTENSRSKAIALDAVNCVKTKGLVTGSTLETSGGTRIIKLSAYDVTDASNYFTGETFKKVSSANRWEGYPNPVYWSGSDHQDFLAYSTSSSSPTVVWNKENTASGFELYVTEESLRDDILYAAAYNCSPDAGNVQLQFHHAQALLDFQITNLTGETITVRSVNLCKALTYGRIKINNNGSAPILSWDTSETIPSTNCKARPDDGEAVSSSPSDKIMAWVLLPFQSVSSDFKFTIDVEVDGNDRLLEIRNNSVEYWFPAKHYVYDITLGPGVKSAVSAAEVETIRADVSLTEKEW